MVITCGPRLAFLRGQRMGTIVAHCPTSPEQRLNQSDMRRGAAGHAYACLLIAPDTWLLEQDPSSPTASANKSFLLSAVSERVLQLLELLRDMKCRVVFAGVLPAVSHLSRRAVREANEVYSRLVMVAGHEFVSLGGPFLDGLSCDHDDSHPPPRPETGVSSYCLPARARQAVIQQLMAAILSLDLADSDKTIGWDWPGSFLSVEEDVSELALEQGESLEGVLEDRRSEVLEDQRSCTVAGELDVGSASRKQSVSPSASENSPLPLTLNSNPLIAATGRTTSSCNCVSIGMTEVMLYPYLAKIAVREMKRHVYILFKSWFPDETLSNLKPQLLSFLNDRYGEESRDDAPQVSKADIVRCYRMSSLRPFETPVAPTIVLECRTSDTAGWILRYANAAFRRYNLERMAQKHRLVVMSDILDAEHLHRQAYLRRVWQELRKVRLVPGLPLEVECAQADWSEPRIRIASKSYTVDTLPERYVPAVVGPFKTFKSDFKKPGFGPL